MVAKLVNYFLPSRLSSDTDNLRTERIFISVLLIAALSDLLGIFLAIEINISVLGYLLFANAAINILLLLSYKNGLSKTVAAHLFLSQHAVSFLIQAYFQGGLMAPAPAAFFLLPAVAMLILGKKPAVWWVSISVIMTTIFLIYESSIGPLQIGYDQEKQKMFFYSSLVGTNVTIFFILLVYENSKNRALESIQKKNADLISTQSQLIQAEKMASLGELTAGIAHEIQNPLNFVNNFSDVNTELIDEMQLEMDKGNLEDAKAISNDIKENELKINHHGKRADAIVKGMLQHSRINNGIKEPTDINALAEEYLRLAYHGLRAKDKSFNATLKTDFDPSIGQINAIPQDLGRVVLNLINNAFYAVNEKQQQQPGGYEPTVTVSTNVIILPSGGPRVVKISVADNGNGIPQKVLDKIYQPFFTTKPSGQGTGLGLSMSYEIVNKGHGGELKVETKEGEGSVFTILLPV
jgi:two-component system, NtrC family, sensor kinase